MVRKRIERPLLVVVIVIIGLVTTRFFIIPALRGTFLASVQPLDSFATADKNGCQIHPFFTASGPTIEILAGYDPTACLDRCHLFPDCVGFVAVPRQRICWLKREILTLTSDQQSVVWRRCKGLNELTEKKEPMDHWQKSVNKWMAHQSKPEELEFVYRGEYWGPKQICAYTESEMTAIMKIAHKCERGEDRFFLEGSWSKWNSLVKPGEKQPVECVIACMHNERPCRDGKCIHPFYIRREESDPKVAYQMMEEPMLDGLNKVPGMEYILEAGANVGIGTSIFATMFRNATIVSVEPSSTNFAMLTLNTGRFSNVIRVHSGLWRSLANLVVVAQSPDEGRDVGAWGNQVIEADEVSPNSKILGEVVGVNVPFLLNSLNLPRFDLAKIDIEGSEREVLGENSGNDLTWLDQLRVLVIEEHEDMRKGAHNAIVDTLTKRNTRWRHLKMVGEESFWVTLDIKSLEP